MSEPIRYTQNIKCVEPSYHAQNIVSGMAECSIGEWVLHSDYAKLQAEVDRLRAASFVTAVPCEEYEKLKAELTDRKAEADRLKAEVERLQKLVGMQKSIDDAIDAWIESKREAAKEGKPSV